MMTICALIALGILLLLVEMFLPGGVCGVIGGLCLFAGIILGFRQSSDIGIGLLLGTAVFGCLALWAWLTFFPRTSVGKAMFLEESGKAWHAYGEDYTVLVRQSGVAHTDLRPSGHAIIGDSRLDVVTQGELITKGARVVVVEVEGNRIVVTTSDEINGPYPSERGDIRTA